MTHRHSAVLHVPVAHHQHIGHLLHLRLADLLADLLVALVHFHPAAQGEELLLEVKGIVVGAVGDGEDAHLLRRHPRGQRAGVLFNEVGQGALVAAHGSAVDDIGRLLLAVGIHILHAELLGKQHVDLNGDQGVLLAEDVLILNIQLGAIEGGLVDAHGVVHMEIVENLGHQALRLFPLLRRALILIIGVGRIPLGEAEGALVEEPQSAQAVLGEIQAAAELILQLLRTEDQVAFGDGELAHTDQAVHLAGILIAEEGGRLAQAHGKIPVAPGAVQKHLVLEGAGHGTQGKALLGLIVGIAQDEHAVAVVIPVAGDLIELALGHIGRLGQQIAPLGLLVLNPALEYLDGLGALGQENGKTLTDDVHSGEVLQLPTQAVVVALQGLGLLFEVRVQLILLRESHAVDPLEHLPAAVAPPVGAAALGELDGVALDAAGGIEVGAGAQVGELALPIEGDVGVLGQVLNQFHLVGLALLLHVADGLLPGQLEALKLELLLADLAHLGLDLLQILLGEGLGAVQVVVEAIVNGRADGQLGIRPQALHRLRQHVGAGVPVGLAVGFVFKGIVVFFTHGNCLL